MRDDLAAALLSTLRTHALGRPAQWHHALGSTNTHAVNMARGGAAHGTLVVADQQWAGRGRFGRLWNAAQGQNLLFSLVLRPPLETAYLGLLSIAAALAVAETLEQRLSLRAQVKWPNDVVLDEQKVCGILIESSLTSTSPEGTTVVMGIGLNVNQDTFPDHLSNATSLLLQTGQSIDRVSLLASLLAQLELRLDALYDAASRQVVRDAYTNYLQHLGAAVEVYLHQSDQPVYGVIEGIGPDGALCLRTGTKVQSLHAGELTFRRR